MKKLFITVSTVMLILMLTGCQNSKNINESTTALKEEKMYNTVSPQQAKEIMDNENGYIILDVRTQEEYNEGHIKNALLIPDSELEIKAETMLTDKQQKILVYCRSGRRSAASAAMLAQMGYTNVIDFGGIINWPYETVK